MLIQLHFTEDALGHDGNATSYAAYCVQVKAAVEQAFPEATVEINPCSILPTAVYDDQMADNPELLEQVQRLVEGVWEAGEFWQ